MVFEKKVHRALNLILSGENSGLSNDYLLNFWSLLWSRTYFILRGEYAISLYVLTNYQSQLLHNHETMSLQLYKGLALFDKNSSWWITAGVITDQVLFKVVQLVFKLQIQIYKRENWNVIHGQNKKCYCISIKAWWNKVYKLLLPVCVLQKSLYFRGVFMLDEACLNWHVTLQWTPWFIHGRSVWAWS